MSKRGALVKDSVLTKMINGLLVYSPRGELIVSKFYKGTIKRSIADIFRIQVINSLDVRSPILTLGSTTFHYIRSSNNMWLVTVNRNNTNSARVWEFLYSLNSVLQLYNIDNDEILKEQFMLVYECLSIMLLENGIIKNTDLNSIVKQMYEKPEHPEIIKVLNSKNNGLPKFLKSPTVSVTTATPTNWRRKKNEIVLYVKEKINILVAKDGSILKAYVDGTIDLTSHLSGNPVCQFGLNDALSKESSSYHDTTKHLPTSAAHSVELENYKFHQCVSLDKFEKDRIIKFSPPDGTVELMKYHVADNLNFPFKVTPIVTTVTSSFSNNAIDYRITLKSLFPSNLSAKDVSLKIPVPPGTIDCKISTSNGSCRFNPEENAMVWKFSKFNGSTENTLSAITVTSDDTTELSLQQWSRPPITLDFELLMFSNSGLAIRYFNVMDSSDGSSGHRTVKWIKYVSQSGAYETRY